MPRRGTAAAIAACAAALGLAAPAQGANITVTVNNDFSITGDCTLRDAISAANTNAEVDECDAGDAGADVITFADGGQIDINTFGFEMAVSEPLTIDAPGDSGGGINLNAAFAQGFITASAPVTLKDISAIQLQADGGNGGLVNSTSTVTLERVQASILRANTGVGGCVRGTDVTFTDVSMFDVRAANGGGCIHATGDVEVTRSTIRGARVTGTGDGGAISATGTVTVDDSTFGGLSESDENWASSGGAISSSGTVTITDSTFKGNQATAGPGGAISLTGTGGGTITNSTFETNFANTTGGSIASQDGTLSLVHDTIRSNGSFGSDIAHTSASGTLTLEKSIVEDQFSALGPNCNGTIDGGVGYNVISGDQGGTTCPTGGTNVAETPLLNPQIGNFGGPTATIMPGSGSPAVDLIPTGSCTAASDQRGVDRPFPAGAPCDAGSVEVDYLVDARLGLEGDTPVGDDVYEADGATQTVTAKVKRGKKAVFQLDARNEAPAVSDRVHYQGTEGNQKFKVKYTVGGFDITPDLLSTGYETEVIAPGADAAPILATVKVAKSAKKGKRVTLPLTTYPASFAERTDVVNVVVKAK